MKRELKDFNPNFQPSQIVCLEHGNTCLYAEVIQVLEERQMCSAFDVESIFLRK